MAESVGSQDELGEVRLLPPPLLIPGVEGSAGITGWVDVDAPDRARNLLGEGKRRSGGKGKKMNVFWLVMKDNSMFVSIKYAQTYQIP